MSKIYTKRGDGGKTSLLTGKVVTKDCVNLRVVGELDELNCILGIAAAQIKQNKIKDSRLLNMLVSIQRDLFLVGAEVAALQSICGSAVTPSKAKACSQLIGGAKIVELEKQIDEWCDALPELKNFILPGGNLPSGYLQLARAVCRRAERELVALGKTEKVRPELYQYLNRLSDWLFVAARWVEEK